MAFWHTAAGSTPRQKSAQELARERLPEEPKIQSFSTAAARRAKAEKEASAAEAVRRQDEADNAAELSALRDKMKAEFGCEVSLEPRQEQIDDYAIIRTKFHRSTGVFEVEIQNTPQRTNSDDQFLLTFEIKNPLAAEGLATDAAAQIRERIDFYHRLPENEKPYAIKLAVYTTVLKFIENKYARQLLSSY